MSTETIEIKTCAKCHLRIKVAHITMSKAGIPRTKTLDSFDNGLCKLCRDSLTKCDGCGIVVAPEWGWSERPGGKVGRYKLCTGCLQALKARHIIHPQDDLYLLIDGCEINTQYRSGKRDLPVVIDLIAKYWPKEDPKEDKEGKKDKEGEEA